MQLKSLAAAATFAAASLFAASSAVATPAAPFGSLGTLGTGSELFGGYPLANATLADKFFFSLAAESDVSGSISLLDSVLGFTLASITDLSVSIDGGPALTLTATNTGYSFAAAAVAPSTTPHYLLISGKVGAPANPFASLGGYIGSVSAVPTSPVPEADALVLALAGAGLVGVMRRRRAH
jgi:MYXO-CTERM domain-containing protein